MSAPQLAVAPKRATIDVVVELSPAQLAPTLPFELRDHVSANTWESRVSTLVRVASRYSWPTLERAFLFFILMLTFLVPVTAYYVTLHALESTARDIDQQVWLARFSSFGITLVTWIVLSAPIIVWKYWGKRRVSALADQWNREDALAAASYGTAPVWRASAPGLFRDLITLVVAVPLTKRSYFDRESVLPPYIAAGDDGLPAYGTQWSIKKDRNGETKYGDVPLYGNDESNAV